LGYQLGEFYLDLAEKALFIHHDKIDISERMFIFLLELLKVSPNLVPKEHLHQVMWPDRQVSDWALARIVSDTRLLLVNASASHKEPQEYIKTARGIGYSIVNSKAVYSPTQVIHRKKRYIAKALLIIGLIVTASVLIIYQTYTTISQQTLIHSIQNIAKHQEYSYRAFQAQALRRNELVAHIETRLNIKRRRQYEKFFAYYFSQMNQEEHFIFSQIRAITTSSLYQANKAILDELEQNSLVFSQIPETKRLAEHLTFWLNKYVSVFLQREDMCLLYVGVEDGVPYPRHIDQKIQDWLAHNI